MTEEEEKEEEEEEGPPVYDLRFENFCDAFGIFFKEGMFVLDFGQSIDTPAKFLARIWIDPSSVMVLRDGLTEQIKAYKEMIEKKKKEK